MNQFYLKIKKIQTLKELEKESEVQLLKTLDDALRRDPIRTTLVDMTKLSLVEITRMKKERPLHESVGKQS